MLRQKKSPELKKLVLILQAWFVLLSMQKASGFWVLSISRNSSD